MLRNIDAIIAPLEAPQIKFRGTIAIKNNAQLCISRLGLNWANENASFIEYNLTAVSHFIYFILIN
jgi:hypothetical protein